MNMINDKWKNSYFTAVPENEKMDFRGVPLGVMILVQWDSRSSDTYKYDKERNNYYSLTRPNIKLNFELMNKTAISFENLDAEGKPVSIFIFDR